MKSINRRIMLSGPLVLVLDQPSPKALALKAPMASVTSSLAAEACRIWTQNFKLSPLAYLETHLANCERFPDLERLISEQFSAEQVVECDGYLLSEIEIAFLTLLTHSDSHQFKQFEVVI